MDFDKVYERVYGKQPPIKRTSSFTPTVDKKDYFKTKPSRPQPAKPQPPITSNIFSSEEAAAIRAKGPINWLEMLGLIDKTELLPFNPERVAKLGFVAAAGKRLQSEADGEYLYTSSVAREKDNNTLMNFLKEREIERLRGVTLGGHISRGVSELPSYAIEFMALRGFSAFGKKVAAKGAITVANKFAASQAGKLAAKMGATKLAGLTAKGIGRQGAARIATKGLMWTAGGVARTTGQPHRVLEAILNRRLPPFQVDQNGQVIIGEVEEALTTSVLKGTAVQIVENMSEEAGLFFGRAGKKVTQVMHKKIPKMAKAITKLLKRIHPGEKVTTFLSKAGYQGFWEEWLEERLGDIMRGSLGLEAGKGNLYQRVLSSLQKSRNEWIVEAGVLSVPGLAKTGMSFFMKPPREMTPAQQAVFQVKANRARFNRVVSYEDGHFIIRDAMGKELVKAKTKEEAYKEWDTLNKAKRKERKWKSDSPLDPNLGKVTLSEMGTPGGFFPPRANNHTTKTTVTEDGKIETQGVPLEVNYESEKQREDTVDEINMLLQEIESLKSPLVYRELPHEIKTNIERYIIENGSEGAKEFIEAELKKPIAHEHKGSADDPQVRVWLGENAFHEGVDPLITLKELKDAMRDPNFPWHSLSEITFEGPRSRALLETIQKETKKPTYGVELPKRTKEGKQPSDTLKQSVKAPESVEEAPGKGEVAPTEGKGIVFEEDQTPGYRERTIKNASADATIAIAVDFTSAGERLTKNSVVNQNKKYIHIDVKDSLQVTPEMVDRIIAELDDAKTLNIAGNGIYTMRGTYTQDEVDAFTLELISAVNGKRPIESIRTGGQTGFDEAGAKAGLTLGIPTKILAPKGWKFRNKDGFDISDEKKFKARFDKVTPEVPQAPTEGKQLPDALKQPVKAPESVEKGQIGQTIQIVPKNEGDVIGMRGPSGEHMNTVGMKPGKAGWLGNPLKWSGNWGKGTLQDCIDGFKKLFLEKVESDPVFKQAVLDLRGKKVGYYRPNDPNHLQVIQEWLQTRESIEPSSPTEISDEIIEPVDDDIKKSIEEQVEERFKSAYDQFLLNKKDAYEMGRREVENVDFKIENVLDVLSSWHETVTASSFMNSLKLRLKKLGIVASTEETGEELGIAGDEVYFKREKKKEEDIAGIQDPTGRKFQRIKALMQEAVNMGDMILLETEAIKLREAIRETRKENNRKYKEHIKNETLEERVKREEIEKTVGGGWTKPAAKELEEEIKNLEVIINTITSYRREINNMYIAEIQGEVNGIEDKKLKQDIERIFEILSEDITPEQIEGLQNVMRQVLRGEIKSVSKVFTTEKEKKDKLVEAFKPKERREPVEVETGVYDQCVWSQIANSNPNNNEAENEKDPKTKLQPSQVERLPDGTPVDGAPLTTGLTGETIDEPSVPFFMKGDKVGWKLKIALKMSKIPILSNMFFLGSPVKAETEAQRKMRILKRRGEVTVRNWATPLRASEDIINEVIKTAIYQGNYARFATDKRRATENMIIQGIESYVETTHPTMSTERQKRFVELLDEIMKLADEEFKIDYVKSSKGKQSRLSLSLLGMRSKWGVGRLEKEGKMVGSEMVANITKRKEFQRRLKEFLPDTPLVTQTDLFSWSKERPRLFFYSLLPEDVKTILTYCKENVQDDLFFSMIDQGILDRTNIVANREMGYTPNYSNFYDKQQWFHGSMIKSDRFFEKKYATTAEHQLGSGSEAMKGLDGKLYTGDGMVVTKKFSESTGMYTEESLNRIQQAEAISVLKAIPYKDLPFGIVTYAPEVKARLNLDEKNIHEWFSENDYVQMKDAPGLKEYHGGGWQEPWVHKSVADILKVFYETQRTRPGKVHESLLRLTGLIKRTVMMNPAKYVYQIMSSPVLWLSWKDKVRLFGAPLLTLAPLTKGVYQGIKNRHNPFAERHASFIDLDKMESYMQMGARFFSPDWVARAMWDSPEAKKHPYYMTKPALAWDFMQGKCGVDRYVFSNMIPKIMYRYIEKVEELMLSGKVTSMGISRDVGKMSPEQARRAAVGVCNTTAGLVNDNVYGAEKHLLQVVLFARNFQASFWRQHFGAALYGTPGIGKWMAKKRRYIAGKGKGSPLNILTLGETPREDLHATGVFNQAHLGKVFIWSYFLFNCIQYGLSLWGDEMADTPPEERPAAFRNFKFRKVRDERDRWLWNNTRIERNPITNRLEMVGLRDFLKIKTPIEDENGRRIMWDLLVFRELYNSANYLFDFKRTSLNKLNALAKLPAEIAIGQTVIGQNLQGRDPAETAELWVKHLVTVFQPQEFRKDVNIDPRWKLLSLWGVSVMSAVSEGSSADDIEVYRQRRLDEMAAIGYAISQDQRRQKTLEEIMEVEGITPRQVMNEYKKRLYPSFYYRKTAAKYKTEFKTKAAYERAKAKSPIASFIQKLFPIQKPYEKAAESRAKKKNIFSQK